MSYRLARLGKELMKILNTAIVNKINDQRLHWVTIIEVELTPDLQYAKVYFSKLSDEADSKQCARLLTRASGFFKKEIGAAHIMRRIPELIFIYDDTSNRARNIESLLKNISADQSKEDSAAEDEDQNRDL